MGKYGGFYLKKYIGINMSIEIRGKKIKESDISNLVGFKCSEFYDRVITSCDINDQDFWKDNLWVYGVDVDHENFDNELSDFLSTFLNVKNMLSNKKEITDIRFHLTINTSDAQIYIPFSTQIIKLLSKLDIPLDVNIVSLGLI